MKLWKFLLLLGGLAVGGLALLLVLHFEVLPRLVHRNPEIAAPDLRGLTVDVAAARLESERLTLHRLREQPSGTIEAGLIVAQDPAPGSPIRAGRVVKVVTSSGPAGTGVPDLVGLSLRQAEMTLGRESYRAGRIVRVLQDGLAAPEVLFQDPPPGRFLHRGEAVDLVVGEPAPATVMRMPDLRGQSLARARQAVAEARCELAPVEFRRDREQLPETVVEQAPEPGRRIREGERVALVVVSR